MRDHQRLNVRLLERLVGKSVTTTPIISNQEAVMLNKSQIKGRGWTESQIKRFLGEPDKKRKNWRYRRSLICLYDPERVEKIESTDEFKRAQMKAVSRRKAALEAAERKRTAIENYIESLNIVVQQMDWDDLVREACLSYNSNRSLSANVAASSNSNQEFLERIMVNFLRHECSRYERELSQVSHNVGAAEARLLLKCRILDAIGDAYPDLALECSNQQMRAYELSEQVY